MTSKLDYLKKYASGDGDGKKRRKKSSKIDKEVNRTGGGLRIVDDEEDMVILDRKKVDKAWEGLEEEEEKPVVVPEDRADSTNTKSGSWVTVGTGGGGYGKKGIVPEGDASPPRRRRRHDSSDEDASPPRRDTKGSWSRNDGDGGLGGGRSGVRGVGDDASPPRRRRRHDCSDEDASPPRRNPGRHDRAGDRAGKSSRVTSGDASPPRRRRKQESSDDDASPPRRNRLQDACTKGRVGKGSQPRAEDALPPRRRRRHDSSDEDASPPRRNPSHGGGAKHGSQAVVDDASPPRRRRRHDSSDDDASPPRRRHEKPNGKRSTPPDSSTQGRSSGGRGYDTEQKSRSGGLSGSNGERERNGRSSGARGDSRQRGRDKTREPSPRRQGCRKSGRSGRNESRSRSRSRDLSEEKGVDTSQHKRGGKESSRTLPDTDSSPSRRVRTQGVHDRDSRRDEERRGEGGPDRKKTASGYYAGLQSREDFKAVEQKQRLKNESEMQAADAEESGRGAETVYRDRKGRKLDMLNEFMRQQDAIAGKEVEAAEAKYAWGRGKVQKETEKQWKEEMDNIAAEPFARSIDDARLEAERKAEIRPDDPMAAYMTKKKSKEKTKQGVPSRPVYKGPPPKPNRFGIGPGYRWDGVDRGNGWEDRIVAKAVDSRHKEEIAYQWATADM